ncbi:MAG: hypothetical protein ACHQF3_00120 [Alphaproteobacteria bacterium]
MESQTVDRYEGRTSSQIVSDIIDRYNLNAVIDETKGAVGNTYSGKTVFVNRGMSDWDAMTQLARIEGYDLFVEGNDLYFQKPIDDEQSVFTVTYSPPTPKQRASGDFVRMLCLHDLTVAGDITSSVRSWNTQKGKDVNATVTSTSANQGARPLEYLDEQPNLTQEQAQQLAQQHADEIAAHECRIKVTDLPLDDSLTARAVLRLAGTGTALDQDYEIESIERSWSFEHGGKMSINGKTPGERSSQ